MPMATAIAMERLFLITLPLIAPALTSSTCFSSTATAGSAEMINQPRSMARGISRYFRSCAIVLPNTVPSAEKPTFTPVRNNTSPT